MLHLPAWLLLVIGMFLASSCSVPNLESPNCTAARNTVKRFYSLHFANAAGPTDEYRNERDELLTDRLRSSKAVTEDGNKDYFTQTENFPKAFRVSECNEGTEADTAVFRVVLLWRDDEQSDQSDVRVTAVKTGDKWLVDEVQH